MKKLLLLLMVIGIACLGATPGWTEDGSALPNAVVKKREMVVTANPLATEAGAHILKIGGTAVDAMIAVQTVLGLVEPQSSGIGGGAFVVYYDAKTGETTTFDAREKAPMAADEYRFASLGFFDAWQSGLSIGVPGVPKLMEKMYVRYGKLPWQRLFVPAKRLAQKGFKLTERTSSQVSGLLDRNFSCLDGERLFFRDPAAFEYFVNTEDCTAKPAGTMMRNKEYANTLKRLAKHGSDAFYYGPVADDIVAAVQGDLNISGDMSIEDLADYEVVERLPVCMVYRGYTVCGMGPPSSGGLAVGQMLGILNNFELAQYGYLGTETVHLFAQAGRLTFADRGKYVGDSDFITVPVEGMLNTEYLQERAALIDPLLDMGTASPGVPPDDFDPYAADPTAKNSGTSHISIVDRYGNALSMTTSVESSFGSGVMVRGFLLNNQLTDFSFNPIGDDDIPVANRVQPGKRPRSSMSPTIVFDEEGQVELVTGSPGGSRIIGYTAQSIINVLDFGLDPQEAINVPHYTNRNGYTQVEEPIPGVTLEYDADGLAADLLDNFGYDDVRVDPLTSGLSVIQVVKQVKEKKGKGKGKGKGKAKGKGDTETLLIGGADMRRDGSIGGR